MDTTHSNRRVSSLTPTSRSSFPSSATYFGYDGGGNNTLWVNPRWAEYGASVAGFTTYYGYDSLDRQKQVLEPLGYSSYFSYDLNGNQTHVVGRRWQESGAAAFTSYYRYDTLDRLIASKTPLGFSSYFGYDANGNQTSVVGPRWSEGPVGQFTTYYGYDALNRRTAMRDAIGEGSYFGYDAVGNLVRTQDHLMGSSSAVNYYVYDANNRMIRSEDALLRTSYFAYDLGGNTIRQLWPGNLAPASYFGYDAENRMTRQLSPVQGSTYYRYDLAGNRTAAVSPRWVESTPAAFTTYYTYDEQQNVKDMTDPLGQTTNYYYSLSGKLTQAVNPRTYAINLEWDAQERLSSVADTFFNTWRRYYDGAGNIVSVVPPAAGSSQFGYDADNRLIQAVNGAAVSTYYAYDSGGNRVRAMLVQAGHASYFGYDHLDRLVLAENGLANSSYFGYDIGGNLSASADPLLHTTYFGYDLLDRIVVVTDPLTNASYFGYDLAGNRSREEDANLHTVYYQYDVGNRVAAIEDALGLSSYYTYDLASNLIRSMDNNGLVIYFNYDALNRKTSQAYNYGYGVQAYGTTPYGGLGVSEYFGYDSVSNLLKTLDTWGASYYLYDYRDRVLARMDPARHTVYYAYDLVSDVTAVVYPQPPSGSAARTYFVYDGGPRMTTANLVTGTNDTCYYAYDGFGNLGRKKHFNNVTCYYTYDLAERVTGMDYRNGSNTQLGLFQFARDAAGNITTLARESDTVVYYSYDAANRLLSETWRTQSTGSQVYAFSYSYDPVGNRLKMRRESTAGTEVSSAYYAYNPDNSLLKRLNHVPASGNVSSYFTYDANGAETKQWDMEPNLTTYFTYAPNGMVSSIVPPTGTADQWTCSYDCRLNRYKSQNGAAAAQYNILEGLKLLETRNFSGDAVTTRNLHGISPVPDIGTLVELQIGSTPTNYTPVMDHRGSMFKLLDSTGAIAFSRQYDAFGVILSGDAGWPSDFGYQTNWQTVKIGNKYYGISAARVYDFDTGRFLSRNVRPELVQIASSANGNALGIYGNTISEKILSNAAKRGRVAVPWGYLHHKLSQYDYVTSDPVNYTESMSEKEAAPTPPNPFGPPGTRPPNAPSNPGGPFITGQPPGTVQNNVDPNTLRTGRSDIIPEKLRLCDPTKTVYPDTDGYIYDGNHKTLKAIRSGQTITTEVHPESAWTADAEPVTEVPFARYVPNSSGGVSSIPLTAGEVCGCAGKIRIVVGVVVTITDLIEGG